MSFKTWEEMSRNEQLHSEFYDFYKDVHNIRPRWIYAEGGTPAYTEEQMEQMLHDLSVESTSVFAAEEAREQAAVQTFERRIVEAIELGAADRTTAVKWLMDAEGADGDSDYMCFLVGIPYGYIKEVA